MLRYLCLLFAFFGGPVTTAFATENFSRPGWKAANALEYVHVDLFNPASSGKYLTNIVAYVSDCATVSFGIAGGKIAGGSYEEQNRPPIPDDATFGESRGLKLDETGSAAYSVAHVRIKRCGPGAGACYIGVCQTGEAGCTAGNPVSRYQYDLGQTHNFQLPTNVTRVDLGKIVLGQNRHLMARCDTTNVPLKVTFEWTEIPVP